MAGTKALAVSDATFESEVLKSTIPAVVDFWAPWCGPCKVIAPIVEEMAGTYEGKVKVLKMDVDENPSNPARYAVRSIPTILFFKNGQVVDQVVGAVPRGELEKRFKTLVG